MSYANPSQPAQAQKRGAIPYVAAGCVVLVICLACAALAGGGYYFFILQRPVTSASGPSVEYILDATSRMAQKADGENDTRLNVARGVLAEIVRPSDQAVTAGLRVFGSGAQSAACDDTALLVPLAPANQVPISTHLQAVTTGTDADAAMSQAMISAIRDLAPFKGKHTLVVVTGGADSCNPQAGALIASEAHKAGIDLQLFVVGYQVPTTDGNAIQGLVDGAGGNYVEADSKDKLILVLTSIERYVQNPTGTSTLTVMATAAAAVGTQNVIVPTTPQAGGTPVASNTSTPSPSATPGSSGTTVPTVAATQGGAGSGGTGQTACDHAYFPMRTGSTWNFSSDIGPQTWTITDVTGDQSNANATMVFKTADVSGTYHWQCTPDGITSFDFGSISLGGGGAVNSTVSNQSGVWLPPEAQLVKGGTWDNAYTTQGTGSSASSSTSVVQHFTIVGTESITAAGETYDALRVDAISTYTSSDSGSGNTPFTINATYWLVRGIGIAQWQIQVDTSKTTLVLQSYSIPK